MQGKVVKRRGEGSSDFRQPGTVYGHRIEKGRTSDPAFAWVRYSFPRSFSALPTTFSTVKPNFSMSTSPGAEAPK